MEIAMHENFYSARPLFAVSISLCLGAKMRERERDKAVKGRMPRRNKKFRLRTRDRRDAPADRR